VSSPSRALVVGIGDIHGRFHRVQEWLAALEQSLGREIDLCLAVGDVEAFQKAVDHRRKAVKRQMPAEFAEYASGARTPHRPLFFIGGNNEDFEALEKLPTGGELAKGFTYLGRSGVRRLAGLEVAFLSGIYAPKHVNEARVPPTTRETIKHAGYFRMPELAALGDVHHPALMLTHEWPRGLFPRGATGKVERPWMGNALTRKVVEAVQPRWLWCGHSHQALAATLSFGGGAQTHVACLDQASKPEGAVFWIEWEQGQAIRAGWGVSGEVAWTAGQPWDASRVPRVL
jgi:Icc-related predicted phosphoesterase